MKLPEQEKRSILRAAQILGKTLRLAANVIEEFFPPALDDETPGSPEQAASPAAPPVEQPAPKKRGPKPKAEQQPETTAQAPIGTVLPPESSTSEPELTRDDLRLLFEPVVKRGDGPKVKEALKKYGAEKLADLEAKDFASFKTDIEVLLA